MRVPFSWSVALLLSIAPACLAQVASKPAPDQKAKPPVCEQDPERRRFDFWIGKWDVRNAQGAQVGTNVIEKINLGCTLLENWTDRQGNPGKSFTWYQPETKQWRQLWADSTGRTTEYAGGFEGDRLVFLADQNMPAGPVKLRMTFTRLPDGRVRQHIESSSDGGQKWTPAFDGFYVRQP